MRAGLYSEHSCRFSGELFDEDLKMLKALIQRLRLPKKKQENVEKDLFMDICPSVISKAEERNGDREEKMEREKAWREERRRNLKVS